MPDRGVGTGNPDWPECDQVDASRPPVEFFEFNSSQPVPTEWIVQGVIPREACMICGAEEKTGKTWFCLETAIALAQGGLVFDKYPVLDAGRTLLVSPEGSRKGLQRRLYGLCFDRYNPDDLGPMLPIWPGRVDLHNDEDIDLLQRAVAWLKPRLLVIDPLVTSTAGLDENDAGAMQGVLNIIRDLMQYSEGMSIVVTHHLGKGHADKSAWHALRGSSVLGAWADGLIRIRRASDEFDAVRRVDVWHRDEESPEPIGFELEVTPIPEVTTIKQIRLVPVDAPRIGRGAASKQSRQQWIDRLLEKIEEAADLGLLLEACQLAAGVSESTIRHFCAADDRVELRRGTGRVFYVGE